MSIDTLKGAMMSIISVMLILFCLAPALAAGSSDVLRTNQEPESGTALSFADMDIEQAVMDRAGDYLKIPTYDGSGQSVHPSVWYFPEKWNGYQYWMAMTPYRGSNDLLENPSIVVSNDGEIWNAPPGLTNPLIANPGQGYNSDPNLFYEEGTLYLLYRYVNAGWEYIYVCSSKDGLGWTEPELIVQINTKDERMLSPCLVKIDGRYALYSIDMKPSPNQMKMRSSDSITSGWGPPKSIPDIAIPGEDIWHFEIIEYNDYYLMLLQQSRLDNTGGAKGQLYLGCSMDGVNWELSQRPVLQRLDDYGWDVSLYKSSLVPRIDEGKLVFDVWYSATSTSIHSNEQWRIGKSVIRFNKDLLIKEMKQQSEGSMVFSDRFDGPNGGLSAKWLTTGTLGIVNRKAGAAVFQNNKAITDVGISDYELTVLVDKYMADEQYLLVRASDMNNFIRCGRDRTNNFVAQNIEDGIIKNTFIKCPCQTESGDYLTVRCQGSDFSIYINGVLMVKGSSNYNQNATMVGMQIPGVDNRYDDFSVRKVNVKQH